MLNTLIRFQREEVVLLLCEYNEEMKKLRLILQIDGNNWLTYFKKHTLLSFQMNFEHDSRATKYMCLHKHNHRVRRQGYIYANPSAQQIVRGPT